MTILFPCHSRARLSEPEARRWMEDSYRPWVQLIQRELYDESASCEIYESELRGYDPGTQSAVPFGLQEYYPRRKKFKSLLVIHPPTGGVTSLNEDLASRACDEGFQVVIVTGAINDKFHDAQKGIHDKETLKAAAIMREVLVYTNSERALCYGESLGGLVCAGVFKVEPKYRGGVLVVTGSPFNEVLAYSELDRLVKLKKKRKKLWGFKTDSEYESLLFEDISLEPTLFARANFRNRVWMFLSKSDTTVQSQNQKVLWSLLEKPRVQWFETNHVLSIARMMFYQTEVVEYLKTLDRTDDGSENFPAEFSRGYAPPWEAEDPGDVDEDSFVCSPVEKR